jgi:hypothetical protein
MEKGYEPVNVLLYCILSTGMYGTSYRYRYLAPVLYINKNIFDKVIFTLKINTGGTRIRHLMPRIAVGI